MPPNSAPCSLWRSQTDTENGESDRLASLLKILQHLPIIPEVKNSHFSMAFKVSGDPVPAFYLTSPPSSLTLVHRSSCHSSPYRARTPSRSFPWNILPQIDTCFFLPFKSLLKCYLSERPSLTTLNQREPFHLRFSLWPLSTLEIALCNHCVCLVLLCIHLYVYIL